MEEVNPTPTARAQPPTREEYGHARRIRVHMAGRRAMEILRAGTTHSKARKAGNFHKDRYIFLRRLRDDRRGNSSMQLHKALKGIP